MIKVGKIYERKMLEYNHEIFLYPRYIVVLYLNGNTILAQTVAYDEERSMTIDQFTKRYTEIPDEFI